MQPTQIQAPDLIKIIQNQDFSQQLRLRLNGDGYDLTQNGGVTAISISLIQNDNQTLQVSSLANSQITIIRGVAGIINWIIPMAQCNVLKTSDGKDVDVVVTMPSPIGNVVFRRKMGVGIFIPAV
jgi:hypothetical protein